MVDPAQWMHETADKACAVMSRVGKCDGGCEGEQSGGNAQGGTVHGSLRLGMMFNE
jgi:hypothetical protein